MFHMGVAEALATPSGKSRYTGPVQSTAQRKTERQSGGKNDKHNKKSMNNVMSNL